MQNHKILQKFGKRIKKLRDAKGWTQETLGDKAGLHRTYIGNIEQCNRNVSLLNIERLAKALKTTPSKLLDTK